MKKFTFLFLAVVAMMVAIPVFAQDRNNEDSVIIKGDSLLTEKWIRSVYEESFSNSDFGSSGLVRGMDSWNGNMYFPLRGTPNSIIVIDGETGSKKYTITLQDDIFSGVTLANNDLNFDSIGNCLIGSCSEANKIFLIYKVDLTTGTTTELINSIVSSRVDAFDVCGDVNSNAIIMATSSSGNKCFRWVITEGIVGNMETLSLPFISGNSARIHIISESLFFVDGNSICPILCELNSGSISAVSKFEDNPTTLAHNIGHNGFEQFQLVNENGDIEYYAIMAATNTAMSPESTYFLIKYNYEDKSTLLSKAEVLYQFPENGFGNNTNAHRTSIASVDVIDNRANIYLYVGENGYAKYTFSNGYFIPDNLVVEPNNKEYGYTKGSGLYEKGEKITIQAFNYNGYIFSHWDDNISDNPRTITIDTDSIIKITAIFEEDTRETKLNGLFSVAKNKYVTFSPGNLQYKSTLKAWRFAENQYDVIGYDNRNISATCYNWIDLFGWGTSGYNNKYPENMRSDNSEDYGDSNNDIANTNYDWGVFNAISNGGNKAGIWRTLTASEWQYIIEDRPNASLLYGLAQINSINGVILLPDNWEPIPNINFVCYDLIVENRVVNIYSLEQWEILENTGAIFLPLAGLRDEYDNVLFQNTIGVYWSSSSSSHTTAYGLYLDTIEVNSNYHNFRDIGRSVRLVKDIIITYNVVVKSNDKTMGNVSGTGEYEHGTEVTLTATPAEGYHFVKWSDGVTEATRTITVTDNVTLSAEFAINVYTVTLTTENGTVTGAGEYEHGTEVILTATPAEGYHFVKWSDGVTEATRTIIVTSDLTLTAEFAINVYSVAVSAENGIVTAAGEYEHGTEVILTATPNEGYHFVKWSDGVTEATRTITITDNITLSAEFAINVYTVTLTTENGIVTGAGEYEHGTEVTLTAIANEGYHFVQWSDGVTEATRTITVTDNITLSAEFAINVYIVTLTTENGIVTGAGEYEHGTEVILTATPNDGYEFVQWSDGVTDATRVIVVTEDIELVAEFRAISIGTDVDDTQTQKMRVYTKKQTLYVEGIESEYYVFDVTGKVTYYGKLPMITLPCGVYIVTTDNGTEYQKVIIK